MKQQIFALFLLTVAVCANAESPWHMLIGGKSGDIYISAVELYNWETGEQCRLPELPEAFGLHSGTVLDGVPIVCGGTASRRCYQYDKKEKNWLLVQYLKADTVDAASTVVSNGWVLFGGNFEHSSQLLTSIDGDWESGPENFIEANFGSCALQLSNGDTAFFGGTQRPNKIITYNWSSGTYTVASETLSGDRTASSCAIIQGKDGTQYVAIVGGVSKGVELWNPEAGTVETISVEIPPEEGATMGLQHSEMIAIKEGKELMFYGGWKGSHHKGIWRYEVDIEKWTRVGSLVVARGEHVAVPVDDIDCKSFAV